MNKQKQKARIQINKLTNFEAEPPPFLWRDQERGDTTGRMGFPVTLGSTGLRWRALTRKSEAKPKKKQTELPTALDTLR